MTELSRLYVVHYTILIKINEWLHNNYIVLNAKKRYIQLFLRSFDLVIKGEPTKRVEEVKYLAVIID